MYMNLLNFVLLRLILTIQGCLHRLYEKIPFLCPSLCSCNIFNLLYFCIIKKEKTNLGNEEWTVFVFWERSLKWRRSRPNDIKYTKLGYHLFCLVVQFFLEGMLKVIKHGDIVLISS